MDFFRLMMEMIMNPFMGDIVGNPTFSDQDKFEAYFERSKLFDRYLQLYKENDIELGEVGRLGLDNSLGIDIFIDSHLPIGDLVMRAATHSSYVLYTRNGIRSNKPNEF